MNHRIILTALMCGWLAGCTTSSEKPTTAPAEKVAASGANNQDYYQMEHDGRWYVFDDAPTYLNFLATGETPYILTRIGGAPDGKSVVFGLSKEDKEKSSGVAAIEMFEGSRQGAEDFYAEMIVDHRFYVFNRWKDLQSFRETGEAALRYTDIGGGPKGMSVIYVLNSQNKDQVPTVLQAQFKQLHKLY